MYARIEPSGVGEYHGNVMVRFSMFLELGDARYDEHHVYVVDETCPIWLAGYKGEVDGEGNPIDRAAYDAWVATCRHYWRDNPFHNHFIYADPDVTDAEVIALAEFHLPNFYEAWRLGKTIRSGWDTAHRIRPLRYEEVDEPDIFALRKAQCEQRAEEIKSLNISVSSEGGGETFPATAIDVGGGATDRAGTAAATWTWIDYNNAANDTGSLDTFELWFNITGAGVKVGTFHGSGTSYTNRDVEVIGDVTSGSKQTFSGKSCDVTSGDWAGVYSSSGTIERDFSGSSGIYGKSGDQFGTGSQTYAMTAGDAVSIYATGQTGGVTHEGAATLSGVGTLAGIGRGIFVGKGTLSGVGSVVASEVITLAGKATLTGTGALSALGGLIKYGVATLSSVGSLSAIGSFLHTAAATLSGVGSLAVSAVIEGIRYGAATLSGAGSLAASAVTTLAGKATLAGVGSLSAIARAIYAAKATLAGVGNLVASAMKFKIETPAKGSDIELPPGIPGGASIPSGEVSIPSK
jgi:hypothetical protein